MLWGLGLQDGAPLCVSVPAGWPGAVCPADAHPHPDHRVCAQPDDGLQPSLQPEPEAVSTPCSEPIQRGGCWGAGRSASPGLSLLYLLLLLLPDVSQLREGRIVSRQVLGWKGLAGLKDWGSDGEPLQPAGVKALGKL